MSLNTTVLTDGGGFAITQPGIPDRGTRSHSRTLPSSPSVNKAGVSSGEDPRKTCGIRELPPAKAQPSNLTRLERRGFGGETLLPMIMNSPKH